MSRRKRNGEVYRQDAEVRLAKRGEAGCCCIESNGRPCIEPAAVMAKVWPDSEWRGYCYWHWGPRQVDRIREQEWGNGYR